MLIAAIVALFIEIVARLSLNYFYGKNANPMLLLIVIFCVIACLVVAVMALVNGIKGIRYRPIRGQSICTTITAGSAIATGFYIILDIALYLVSNNMTYYDFYTVFIR